MLETFLYLFGTTAHLHTTSWSRPWLMLTYRYLPTTRTFINPAAKLTSDTKSMSLSDS